LAATCGTKSSDSRPQQIQNSNEGRHKTTKKKTQEKQTRTTICPYRLSLCDSNSTAEGGVLLFTLQVTFFQISGRARCEIGRAFSWAAAIRRMPYMRRARSHVYNITQLVDVILILIVLSLDISAVTNKMTDTSNSSRKMS
jgi:hypothetical protein